MADKPIDPAIYGAAPAVPPEPTGSQPILVEPQPKVALNDLTLSPAAQAQGEGVLAHAQRPPTSVLESFGAGFQTTMTAQVAEAFNAPDFTPDKAFKPADFVKAAVKIPLTEDEAGFLGKARSSEEAAYRYGRIKDTREVMSKMGDHPVAGLLGAAFDPGMVGIDIASAGASRLLKLGRVAGAITTAGLSVAGNEIAGTYGQQADPVSDQHVLWNSLLNGAAGGLFYRPGKGLVPHDPAFPEKDLGALAQTAEPKSTVPATKWEPVLDGNGNPVTSKSGKPVYKATTDADPPKNPDTASAARQTATVVEEAGEVAEAVKAPPRPAPEAPAASTVEPPAPAKPKATASAEDAAATKTRPGVAEVTVNSPETKLGDAVAMSRDSQGRVKSRIIDYDTNPRSASAVLGDMLAHADPFVSQFAQHLLDKAAPILDKIKVHSIKEADTGGAAAFYHSGAHSVMMGPKAPAWAPLHEIAHALTSIKLSYGKNVPTSAHGALYRQLDNLRKQAVKYATETGHIAATHADGSTQRYTKYFLSNADEFVAGLYSGSEKNTLKELLAKMPDKKGGSMLGGAVDIVRKLLGLEPDSRNALLRAMKITDQILDTPIDAKLLGKYGMDTVHLLPPATPAAAGKRLEAQTQKWAGKLSWSLNKSLAKHFGQDVADILVDNPLNMTGNSIAGQKRAIRAGLQTTQYGYEDALKKQMAAEGAGIRQRIMEPRKSMEIQKRIEEQVRDEMLAREQRAREGTKGPTQAPPHIQEMADHLQKVADQALDEMQRAGVKGAKEIDAGKGYFSRKWDSSKIDAVENKFKAAGLDDDAAKAKTLDLMKRSIMAANPGIDPDIAHYIGAAIRDRTIRKGYFEDSAFRAHAGNNAAKEQRDILQAAGVPPDRIQEVLDVITGHVDEAGKLSALKHRVDLDFGQTISMPDGSLLSAKDMIRGDLANITEGYLDNVAGQSALARAGYTEVTAVDNLRTGLLKGIASESDRAEAAKLFDGTMAHIRGEPVGEDLSRAFRNLQGITSATALAASGLWQVTEYATAMQRYGMLRSFKYAMQEMPILKGILGDTKEAGHLANVLGEIGAQDQRMRPFLTRMEDNFEFKPTDVASIGLNHAKQLVPYINAMHYIHHHQSRMVGNLIANVFERGASGDAKAIAQLGKYGMDEDALGRAAMDIKAGGMDTTKWSDATWDAVRGPLSKMVDESILRGRLGEVPAFAQFSQVGKFIFTYRSFVLSAHNKLMSGTFHREGITGMAMLLAYQLPLSVLAVQANNIKNGHKSKGLGDDVNNAIGQMGSLGLVSDLWGAIVGQKQQFGAPGLSYLDRAYKLGGALGRGNFGTAANTTLQAVPFLSLIPGIRAMGQVMQDNINPAK